MAGFMGGNLGQVLRTITCSISKGKNHGAQHVTAPVALRIKPGMGVLEGEAVRTRGIEGHALALVERRGKVRVMAGLAGVRALAGDQVDRVGLQVVGAVAGALVAVGDGAAIPEAPMRFEVLMGIALLAASFPGSAVAQSDPAESVSLAIRQARVVEVTSFVTRGPCQITGLDVTLTATPDAGSELTDREREIVQLIAEGMSTRAIAARLHVSHKTIGTHRGNIMNKLGISSVARLTKYAIRQGLTSLD